MAMIDRIMKERAAKAEEFRKLGIDPYATKSGRTNKAAEVLEDYDKMEGKEVTVAGRVMFWRDFGKLAFAKVRDESGEIQVILKKDNLGDIENQLKLYDVGDIVDATGKVTKSKTGEISVEATAFTILTKAVRPLPEKREGLKNIEERYRRRYLDILMNEDSRQMIVWRAEIEKAIREFLWEREFVEVDTPILQPTYGGTNAKPFYTHLNALNVDLYLAVAHELYLKKVIVAGIENVFTLGRCFRNEGVDKSHNPEFVLLETMSAYHNYEYNMDLTEEMYRYICDNVFGRTTFKVCGQNVDLGKPWRRVMMVDLVREEKGIDFEKLSLDEANELLKKAGVEEQPTIGNALVQYMEATIAPSLIQPTIVYGHPVEISPLVKRIPGSEKYVERFELYFGGMETGDNWSELNDPTELRARFEEEQRRKEEGDEEAHPMDLDFVEAMEYGMAPTTGLGPGIERLAMMLGETENIDDVIWFPLVKPDLEEGELESGAQVTGKLTWEYDYLYSKYGLDYESIEIPDIEGDDYLSMTGKFRAEHPSATAGYVVIEGISVHDKDKELSAMRNDIVKSLRGITKADIDADPRLRSFRDMYRKMGVDFRSRRPSPEALLRRISQGRDLYSVNNVVDAYNAIVITQQISSGAFDIDQMKAPMLLDVSNGNEEMTVVGGEVKSINPGEVVYRDKVSPYNIDYNYRDSDRTKITEKTKNIIINAEGVGDISAEDVRKALQLNAAVIQKFCGGKIVQAGLVRASTQAQPSVARPMNREEFPYDDKKISLVVADDIDTGVAMNVVGHLNVAVGNRGGDIMGRDSYSDSSGVKHLGISRYPVIVLKGSRADIKELVSKAESEGLVVIDYPEEMFTTRTDDDLNDALSKRKNEDLSYYGVALVGGKKKVDKLTKQFKLYK